MNKAKRLRIGGDVILKIKTPKALQLQKVAIGCVIGKNNHRIDVA